MKISDQSNKKIDPTFLSTLSKLCPNKKEEIIIQDYDDCCLRTDGNKSMLPTLFMALQKIRPDMMVRDICQEFVLCCKGVDGSNEKDCAIGHGYYPGTNYHTCICGCTRLKYTFAIKMRHENITLFPIGSECIELFENEKLDVVRKRHKAIENENAGLIKKSRFSERCSICSERFRKKDLTVEGCDLEGKDVNICLICAENDLQTYACADIACGDTTYVENTLCNKDNHHFCKDCGIFDNDSEICEECSEMNRCVTCDAACVDDYCEKCDNIRCTECDIHTKRNGKCYDCKYKRCKCGKVKGKNSSGKYYPTCYTCFDGRVKNYVVAGKTGEVYDWCYCGKKKQERYAKCYTCNKYY